MNTLKINRKRGEKKRKDEGIDKRTDTLIKKAYELGEFDGIDEALIIWKHGQYTMYKSRDHASWPLSMAEGVSKAIVCLEYTTSTNNYLGSCLSSPKEYTSRRH